MDSIIPQSKIRRNLIVIKLYNLLKIKILFFMYPIIWALAGGFDRGFFSS